ncbi:hypothetical protein KAR91_20385 [Candidatus Pacearchaeota archaeon]|nr:hypothetical protein [Candidatus Pacearchaeota archaeon]
MIPSAELDVFKKELALIADETVYKFVSTVFRHFCPDYFWHIPASDKNLNHSPVCRLRGGLVHHVKLAVGFADTFLDMLGIDDTDPRYSQTIAAVLLHDMFKRGLSENELDTFPDHHIATRNHGRYCANHFILRMHIAPEIEPVIRAIELHMGRWTHEVTNGELAELKDDEVVRTTHLADYAASRPLHHYLAERCMDPTMEYLRG